MILEDSVQQRLRRVGDLYVAENVLTKERRQLSLSEALLSANSVNESASSRELLKG